MQIWRSHSIFPNQGVMAMNGKEEGISQGDTMTPMFWTAMFGKNIVEGKLFCVQSFRLILAYFGTFGHSAAHFGSFRHISAHFGSVWRILAQFGSFWHILASRSESARCLDSHAQSQTMIFKLLSVLEPRSTANFL